MTMQNNPWVKDFPILAADENGNRLVYLDSAATTQHPTQVLDAVTNYYKHDNANPHRGVYELAMRATDAHEGARHRVAQFFHAQDDEIVFTQNTTESLNLVACSYGMHFLHEGDEIVISVAAHHSNQVPWQRVAQATGAKLVYLYPNAAGYLTEEELDRKITAKTRLVAVGMVSNVLGLRAPVEAIVARAHAVGAVVVLDCAQSAVVRRLSAPLRVEGGAVQHYGPARFGFFTGEHPGGEGGEVGILVIEFFRFHVENFLSSGDGTGRYVTAAPDSASRSAPGGRRCRWSPRTGRRFPAPPGPWGSGCGSRW